MAKRLGVTWGSVDCGGTRRRTAPSNWKKPLTWQRKAKRDGVRPLVFPSMCDLFEDWKGPIVDAAGVTFWIPPEGYPDAGKAVPIRANIEPQRQNLLQKGYRPLSMADCRRDWFEVVSMTPDVLWLVLTKRPENVQKMVVSRDPNRPLWLRRENVWLGASVSDQETADKLIPELLKLRELTPCLFVSVEPLLASLDIAAWISELDWCIVGGESGPKARPCNVQWIRDVMNDCERADVPCFVKQVGRRCTLSKSRIAAGCFGDRDAAVYPRHPKGGDPSEWPKDLRVQQYPDLFK